MHFECTNRAGDALKRVGAALERKRVIGGGSLAHGRQAHVRLGQKGRDDARYAIWTVRALHLPQRLERRNIDAVDAFWHITV